MRPPSRRYFREPVTVSTHTGEAAYGSVHADPVTVLAAIDDRTKVVRRGNGDEVTVEMTVVLPPFAQQPGLEERVDAVQLLTEESTVNVRDRPGTVLAVTRVTERGRLLYVAASIG